MSDGRVHGCFHVRQRHFFFVVSPERVKRRVRRHSNDRRDSGPVRPRHRIAARATAVL